MVHLAHGNNKGAIESLGARALLPLGGALIGMTIASQGDDSSDYEDDDFEDLDVLAGAILGFAAGGVTAMVLDWTVFSKKETTTYTPARYVLRNGLRPGVKISRGGLSLSLGGSF